MSTRLVFLLLAAGPFCTAVAHGKEPLFGREVVPTLFKLGCSAGTCHGSFSGKGGFRLSLFASDPAADYREVRGALGRRLNLQAPEDSLLLLKPSGKLPHGGGLRLKARSEEYRLLKGWIESGAPYNPAAEGRVASVRVEPARFTCRVDGRPVALRVLARMHDGAELDVTRFARFEPFDASVAEVDEAGQVRGRRSGDVHILAHYAGQIGYAIALIPQALPAGVRFPEEKLTDPVDRLIADKLKRLNILPSPVCDDATFVRRVYLDVTGQLPTPTSVSDLLVRHNFKQNKDEAFVQ